MERKPSGPGPERQVGMGPAGGRQGGVNSRASPRGKRKGGADDWSGFAKGLATGAFLSLSIGFIALGAWFRTEDGAPYRHMLSAGAKASLGGIPATVETPEGQAVAADDVPSERRVVDGRGKVGTQIGSVAPRQSSAPSAPGAAGAPTDGLEGLGVDDLLKAQERNQKVVGQAGKLLKAIGGSSR